MWHTKVKTVIGKHAARAGTIAMTGARGTGALAGARESSTHGIPTHSPRRAVAEAEPVPHRHRYRRVDRLLPRRLVAARVIYEDEALVEVLELRAPLEEAVGAPCHMCRRPKESKANVNSVPSPSPRRAVQ